MSTKSAFHVVLLIAFLASPFLAGGVARAHPLHTSLTQIWYDPKTGDILVSLRVFVDDFTKASKAYVAGFESSSSERTRSPLISYALSTFTIADEKGGPLKLESCGIKRVGDLMWLCFKAPAASPPKSIRVQNRILFDMYKDQINVVQSSLGGRKTSTLFTPEDRAKHLR